MTRHPPDDLQQNKYLYLPHTFPSGDRLPHSLPPYADAHRIRKKKMGRSYPSIF